MYNDIVVHAQIHRLILLLHVGVNYNYSWHLISRLLWQHDNNIHDTVNYHMHVSWIIIICANWLGLYKYTVPHPWAQRSMCAPVIITFVWLYRLISIAPLDPGLDDMIMLMKLVACLLLIGAHCCGIASSQSQSESCTNRSMEYADCISRAERSVSFWKSACLCCHSNYYHKSVLLEP